MPTRKRLQNKKKRNRNRAKKSNKHTKKMKPQNYRTNKSKPTDVPLMPPTQSTHHNCTALQCELFCKESKIDGNDKRKNQDERYQFDQFIETLTMDYEPFQSLSLTQKMQYIKNKMIGVRIQSFRQMTDLLECISWIYLHQPTANQASIRQLHSDILMVMAHYRLNALDPPIKDVLLALHDCNMVSYMNNTNHIQSCYLQIRLLFKLGLAARAESMLQTMDCASDVKYQAMIDKERNSIKANNIKKCIEEYQHFLLQSSSKEAFRFDTDTLQWLCCWKWNQIAWDVVFVSIADLLYTKRWKLAHLYDFLRGVKAHGHIFEAFNCDEDMFVIHLLPQCVSIVSAVLNWSPKEMALCVDALAKPGMFTRDSVSLGFTTFDMFLQSLFGTKSRNYAFMNEMIGICCEQWKWDLFAMNKVHIYSSKYVEKEEYRSKTWKQFVGLMTIWETDDDTESKYIPSDGRTKEFGIKYNQNLETEENVDFIFIYAVASVLKKDNVLKELNNMKGGINLSLYYKTITYLHYFALNGCIETVRFLVGNGMNVNCIVKPALHQPMTPLDYSLKGQHGLDILPSDAMVMKNSEDLKARAVEGIKILKQLGGETARKVLGDAEYERRRGVDQENNETDYGYECYNEDLYHAI